MSWKHINGFTYTKEQKDFLLSFKEDGKSYSEIAKLFNEKFKTNKSRCSIQSICRSLGYKQRVKTPYKLNEEEINFLKEHYQGISRKELTRLFNEHFNTSVSASQIKQSCNLRGWHNGLTGKFGTREDWIPWNKNLTKEELNSHYPNGMNVYGMIKSNIKYHKGDIVKHHDWLYIVIEEPNGKDNWSKRLISLSRYVWEQHNGKIPKGYKIIFKDGNPENCDIENLMMVNNQTFMQLAKLNAHGLGKITEAVVELDKTNQLVKTMKV